MIRMHAAAVAAAAAPTLANEFDMDSGSGGYPGGYAPPPGQAQGYAYAPPPPMYYAPPPMYYAPPAPPAPPPPDPSYEATYNAGAPCGWRRCLCGSRRTRARSRRAWLRGAASRRRRLGQ